MADSRQPLRENCHSRHGHFNNNDWEILNAALCNGALVEHQKLAALMALMHAVGMVAIFISNPEVALVV